jgi:hypothetical protein
MYIKSAATLVIVEIAIFLLFGTFVEFLETSIILFAALVVYALYSGAILPALDRWVAAKGEAAHKAPHTKSDAFDRLPRPSRYLKVITFISVLVISFFILHLLRPHDARILPQHTRLAPRSKSRPSEYHLWRPDRKRVG